MSHWILLAAPFLIAAVVLALAFTGCDFEIEGVDIGYPGLITSNQSVVSYWEMDEIPGVTVAVDSMHRNDGAYKGAVRLGIPGLLKQRQFAADFDGQSGYVSVPYKASLNQPKFTVEALVEIAGGDDTLRAIVSSRAINAGKQLGYGVYVSEENRWEAWIGDGTSGGSRVQVGKVDAVKVGAGPPRGPYYVAMVYNGNRLGLYVNPFDGTDPDQAASNAASLKPNTKNELRIGAGANEQPNPKYFFNGIIDEVAIYNDVIPFDVIQNHFSVAYTGQGTTVQGN
jgi:hypothetical protein